MKNLVIIGGGTAGWFTSLYCKKSFPEYNVILIESEQIGILGAGETGTPNILGALSFLDISIEEMIKNTGATIKNALKFINHTSTLTGKRIDEKDIDYREMINYIESVSGDIETCFREKGGVPFKYSLNMYLEDSKEITDLSYDFLN